MPPPSDNATRLDNRAVREGVSLEWFDYQTTHMKKAQWHSTAIYDGKRIGSGTGNKKGIAHDAAAVAAFETLDRERPPRQQAASDDDPSPPPRAPAQIHHARPAAQKQPECADVPKAKSANGVQSTTPSQPIPQQTPRLGGFDCGPVTPLCRSHI